LFCISTDLKLLTEYDDFNIGRLNSRTFSTLVHAGILELYLHQRKADTPITADRYIVGTTVLAVHVPARVDGTRYRLVARVILPTDVLRWIRGTGQG